ncbi:MAG: 30S ribosomal protein S17e [Candidatus Bathyarchaeia archaeon]|nr:30S ribosomal protein S17e [Candidatus Bathyarchaeota archaeon]
MGKVRIELVKRASKELVGRYPERFTANFEENKQFLKEIEFTLSKRLRNRVAGYITRMMKAKIAQLAESTQGESVKMAETEPEA